MTRKKRAAARVAKSTPRARRRNCCLICGDVVGTAAADHMAHVLKAHLPAMPDAVMDGYAMMTPGVPQMRKVIRRAERAAAEVLELERMFALPDRRRRKGVK